MYIQSNMQPNSSKKESFIMPTLEKLSSVEKRNRKSFLLIFAKLFSQSRFDEKCSLVTTVHKPDYSSSSRKLNKIL